MLQDEKYSDVQFLPIYYDECRYYYMKKHWRLFTFPSIILTNEDEIILPLYSMHIAFDINREKFYIPIWNV